LTGFISIADEGGTVDLSPGSLRIRQIC